MTSSPRNVLVTGAAGGLGSAMAKRLVADGYGVILSDRHSCADVIDALGTSGKRVWDFPCDLSDRREIDALLRRISREIGGIDILINNAAALGPCLYQDLSLDRLDLFFSVNVMAAFQLSQGLAPGMAERKWGRIINIVSSSAWGPYPGFTAYVSSKMALVGMTRCLAVELGDSGVTVNAITPALTWHDQFKSALPESVWEDQRQRQAIHRTATPEDLVGGIAFLCSDDSAFMTAQTLFLDGGAVIV